MKKEINKTPDADKNVKDAGKPEAEKSEEQDPLLVASRTDTKKKTDLIDYFEMWRVFPELKADNPLLENLFRSAANERIRRSGKRLHTQDTVKQAIFSVLELCAEKYMLEQIIDRDRKKIKQLEESQKKINETLRALLKRMADFALTIHIER